MSGEPTEVRIEPSNRTPLIRRPFFAVAAVLQGIGILATIRAAPAIWVQILPFLQPEPLYWYVAAGLLGAALLGGWAFRSSPHGRRPAALLLGIVLVLYLALVFGYYRGEKPVKRFHLLEYGSMSVLAFEAMARRGARRGVLLATAFLLLIATVDETAQGFVTGRTFRWLDLFGNYLACLLGAGAFLAVSAESPLRGGPRVTTP